MKVLFGYPLSVGVTRLQAVPSLEELARLPGGTIAGDAEEILRLGCGEGGWKAPQGLGKELLRGRVFFATQPRLRDRNQELRSKLLRRQIAVPAVELGAVIIENA